ncbi:divergent polysaccharide deacetylase family protein [candidate division KSB1 bacterium]|nr:divergent polysaccharide deacetylase family protein [candidate division KSB1 bacterium]
MSIKRQHRFFAPDFKGIWKKIAIGIIVVALFLIIFNIFFLSREASISRPISRAEKDIIQQEQIGTIITDILFKYGIKTEWITQTQEQKVIQVPTTLPIIQICQEIVNNTRSQQTEILNSYEDLRTGTIILELGYKKKLLYRLKFIRNDSLLPGAGKIALIIDDFGYFASGLVQEFFDLDFPFTISIIPGLKYSNQISEHALLNEKEILIHFPMEPLNEKIETNPFLILTSLSDEEIRIRVQKANLLIQHAIGVNNHQGSRATADERVMRTFLDALKVQKLFFIDSRTTNLSVGNKIATEINLPNAGRDIFLDHEDNVETIKNQLMELARLASKKQYAIGIGHLKPNTLQVLKEEIPGLQRLGYEFIFISEVFKIKQNIKMVKEGKGR